MHFLHKKRQFRALSANAYERNRLIGLFNLKITKSVSLGQNHDSDVKVTKFTLFSGILNFHEEERKVRKVLKVQK